MCAEYEYQEMCGLCGRLVGMSESPTVFRLVEDHWSHRETWEEMVMICQKCFTEHVFIGLFRKGAFDAKTPSEIE